MRLETIAIKGVLAFPELVTVDLRDLPPGIVAIVGPVGHGKTTFLEACPGGLLREFPSRDKQVVKYAVRPDAFIDQTFSLDGQGVFRARLNLDGEKDQSDAQLTRILADGSSVALSDGKVTDYDRAVSQIVPPMKSWLMSVFSSQNRRGSFATSTKAEKKELFGYFLGLDAYDEWSGRASRAAALVQEAIAALQARRDLLARDAGADLEVQLQAESDRVTGAITQVEDSRVALQRDLTAIDAELLTLQTAAATHAASQARLDRVLVDIQTATSERTSTLAALDRLSLEEATERRTLLDSLAAAIAAIDRRAADTSVRDRETAAIAAGLTRDLADIQERIANNQALADAGRAIRDAAADLVATERAIEEARASERAALEDVHAARTRALAIAGRLAVVAEREAALERARKAAQGLTTVPFGDDCAPCHFMATAAAARAEIPGLEDACAERAAIEAERDRSAAGVATIEQLIAGLRASILTLVQHGAQLRPQAERLVKLEQATERIASLTASRAEKTAAAATQEAAAHDRERARQAALVGDRADREQQHAEQLATLAHRIVRQREEAAERADALAQRSTALLFERDNLQEALATTKDASERAAAQTALLTLRRAAWDVSTQTLTSQQHQRTDLAQRLAAVRARRAELAGIDARIRQHTEDRREWEQLAKALGRDGLQTLEIDAAGPTVSAFTNDLLQSCFGPRFTVELVTQEARAVKGRDGATHREVFDLKVYDNEKGGAARDLTDLSGGQQVLVDEALKNALAVYVNKRNRAPMRTCWRDETTGSLGVPPYGGDTAARYVEMLRRVQQIGGFHHVFFITHNPEAALQADAQIVVTNGAIEVRQPPYASIGSSEAA